MNQAGLNPEYHSQQRDARKQKLSSLRDNSLVRNILEGKLERQQSHDRKKEQSEDEIQEQKTSRARAKASLLPQLNPALNSLRIEKNSLTSKNAPSFAGKKGELCGGSRLSLDDVQEVTAEAARTGYVSNA